MKFTVALLFLVIALIAFTQGVECGDNEVFNYCAPGCEGALYFEKSCDPQPFVAQNCPDVCRPTCECAPNFSRHRNGKCVKTC